jgi:hypothetical protein
MNEPFGQADCESEVRSLKADYRELYFDETPFNEAALKSETYLIIGRRGSGKTALSHYFSFKKAFDDPIYIDVDEPALYQKFLSELAAQAGESRELAIYRLQRIWYYVVWTVILEHTRGLSADIERACEPKRPRRSVSEFINGLLQTLVEVFRDGDGDIGDVDLEGLFTSPMIKQAREAVLALARRRPVVMAIDTLERRVVNLAPGEVRVSKIRRDPPPKVKEIDFRDRDDRNRWAVAIGVLVFALALVVIILALAIYSGWSPRQIKLEV